MNELAERVDAAAAELGIASRIVHADNPRVAAERHYYNPRHTKLLEPGLEPHLFGPQLISSMLTTISRHADRIDRSKLTLGVRSVPTQT